ncbi:C39 family peptidase [Streptomyces sp. NPDC059340]|uniref:C39 family peptidase n=1 Tax=Streptomyces sp. NPDC059340 TaxID=3346806 RepID=UPI0036AF4A08
MTLLRSFRKTAITLTAFALTLGVGVLSTQSAAAVDTTWHTTPFSGQVQQKSTWCGPGAAATLLTSWRISGVSQATLAREMKTDRLGTWPEDIPGPLNKHIDAHLGWPKSTKPYRWYSGVGNTGLWNYVVRDINKKRALMILIDPRKIPWDGGSYGEGHYFTVVGYNYDYHGHKAYSVWDPAVGSLHTLAASDWTKKAWNYSWIGNFAIA